MIFKHLFRPKYQDPNPKIRIQAIADLDPQEPAHRSQLHELAFNDSDAKVAIAALERLNSFALWSKMAETSTDERIRKKAAAVVEGTVLGNSQIIISEQDKITYLKECSNNALLEKVLRVYIERGDTEVVLAILKKLNKPHLNRQVLLTCKEETLQLALLEHVDDQQTMQKVLKKTDHDSVKALIGARLDEIADAKIRPAEVKKQVSLILSQLLALKDEHNLPRLQEKRSQLETEFEQLKSELSWLSEESRADTLQKYVEISNRLDQWTARLTPVWNQQHAADIAQQQFDALHQQLASVLNRVAHALSTDASNITLGEVEQFENDLHAIETSLTALKEAQEQDYVLAPNKVEAMYNDINGCRTTLESLPEFQKAISEAKTFLQAFSAVPLPDEASQIGEAERYLNEQRQIWKGFIGVYRSSWPASLSQQFTDISSTWKDAMSSLKKASKAQVNKCASKIRAAESMVRQGRYKTAFAIFAKVQTLFDGLPEAEQRQLSRRFERIKSEITNLKDWQDYIAKPRKPSLLEEAQKLVALPGKPDEQAKHIKHLRQQWNSLGKTDDEDDRKLNQAFDDALEQAFEVCKAHYAEQQAKRLANLAKKKALIEQFAGLSSEQDAVNLTLSFRQLQKQWREVGEIDYKVKGKIYQQYQDVTQPLKARIDLFHQDNAEQKHRLIVQAKALSDEPDIEEAIDKAKLLQQQWKAIPPAKRKLDNELWEQFRQANDAVFAKRKAQQSELQQKHKQITDALERLLAESEQAIDEADNAVSLTHAMPEEDIIQTHLSALPGKIAEKFEKRWHKLLSREQKLRSHWQQQREAEHLKAVLACLEVWKSDELPEAVESLPGDFAGAFRSNQKPLYSRHELVIMMEILNDKASPKQDTELRKNMQLQLMADKLERGEVMSIHSLLKMFISHGPITGEDSERLSRLKHAVNTE